ncbi:unnamed protein product [Staurois parvus]|uniref:Uncharacterized protein n=1 Tax=Staurois parvus TaxID=386267 RepID=A0ABN9AUF3_9NEOB|nr:unnamed protein product [Staurois parvus]
MYVKWFDTVMFYYVILVNVTFCNFQISRRSVPHTSRRSQGTESTGLHFRGTLQEGHCGRAGQGK